MEHWNIRHAEPGDLPALLEIYRAAREAMKRAGNPTQWGDHSPRREQLEEDLALRRLYVLEEGGAPCAAFVLALGPDPTYASIEGRWLSDAPYGTIHRLARGEKTSGVFARVLPFCERIIPHLRIDTHRDNAPMRHLIETSGFLRCGIITVADGSPRIAYEKCPGLTSGGIFSRGAGSSSCGCKSPKG